MFLSNGTEKIEIEIQGEHIEIEATRMPNCYLARFRRPTFSMQWIRPSLNNPQNIDDVIAGIRKHLGVISKS